MQITYLGLNCFRIQTKNNLVVTDPYSEKSGLKMPRFKADIITVSNKENENANNTKSILSPQLIVEEPGEYERANTFIYGIKVNGGKNTIFLIEDEGIFIAHLGFLEKELTEKELEKIKTVDILLIPATGLDSSKISKTISLLEPRLIIPMNYKIPKLKIKAETLEKVTKALGASGAEELDKLKISKKDLPQENTQVIILKPDLK